MKTFSSNTYTISNEFEDVCSHLKQELYAAESCIQDSSGQEALAIVSELVEETMIAIGSIRSIAEQIKQSAELLEESNALL